MSGQCSKLLCMQEKINAKRLHLAHNGVLVIGGEDISIESLHVEGALVVDAVPGARLTINGLHVQNDGWRWMGLKPNKPMTEDMAIRHVAYVHCWIMSMPICAAWSGLLPCQEPQGFPDWF